MITTEPQVSDNGRYTVTQAKNALLVSRQTIYRHTEAKALRCTIHKATGKRLYSGSELKKFWRSTY